LEPSGKPSTAGVRHTIRNKVKLLQRPITLKHGINETALISTPEDSDHSNLIMECFISDDRPRIDSSLGIQPITTLLLHGDECEFLEFTSNGYCGECEEISVDLTWLQLQNLHEFINRAYELALTVERMHGNPVDSPTVASSTAK
jgi:hypothetical protein